MQLTINIPRNSVNNTDPIDTSEYDFWYLYVSLLSIKYKSFLTESEKKILSFVFSSDPLQSCFKGEKLKALMKHTNIKGSGISNVKKVLVSKGLLEPGDGLKGDFLLHNTLRTFQVKIKDLMKVGETTQINFLFPLNIVEDVDSTKN